MLAEVTLLRTFDRFLQRGSAVQPAPLAGTQVSPAQDGDTATAHATLDFLDPGDTSNRLGLVTHCEILDIIGRGGMAVVLRAWT